MRRFRWLAGADAARAIKTMQVRGAPLIGATAAYGMALALRDDASDAALERAYVDAACDAPDRDQSQMGARRDDGALAQSPARGARRGGLSSARKRSPTRMSRSTHAIGRHGLQADRGRSPRRNRGEPVNVLTHCNAGWLATVDWGTATVADLSGASTRAFRSMCGSTRRARAIRALRSPRGSSASTACRIP